MWFCEAWDREGSWYRQEIPFDLSRLCLQDGAFLGKISLSAGGNRGGVGEEGEGVWRGCEVS